MAVSFASASSGIDGMTCVDAWPVVHEDVNPAGLLDLEPRRKALEPARTWPVDAWNENTISDTENCVLAGLVVPLGIVPRASVVEPHASPLRWRRSQWSQSQDSSNRHPSTPADDQAVAQLVGDLYRRKA